MDCLLYFLGTPRQIKRHPFFFHSRKAFAVVVVTGDQSKKQKNQHIENTIVNPTIMQ